MKRLFALLMAAVMLLSLTACSKGGTEKPAGTTGAASEEDNSLSFTFTKFGKAKITILGAEMKKTEDDEDFMRIYYDYLNMDETAAGHSPVLALDLEITQDGATGKTKVTGFDYVPIYLEKDEVGAMRLLRIEEAIAGFENQYLDGVSEETYNAMKTALDRIKSRVGK